MRHDRYDAFDEDVSYQQIIFQSTIFKSEILTTNKLRKAIGFPVHIRGSRRNGQATKSARGMPWRWEPTKDAANCEKPR